MRKARKAEEQQQKARDAKQWRDKSLQEGRKKVARGAVQQKPSGGKQSLAAGAAPGGANHQQQQQQQKGQQPKEQQGQQQQQGGGKGGKRQREEEGGLTFNKLDFGSGAWLCWLPLLVGMLLFQLLLEVLAELRLLCLHAINAPLLKAAALFPLRSDTLTALPLASLLHPQPAEPRHQKKRQRKQSKQQLLEAAQAKQAAVAELSGSADGKVRRLAMASRVGASRMQHGEGCQRAVCSGGAAPTASLSTTHPALVISQAQLAKEAWGAALQRAKGDKVLDDPRLLKRSLKKVGCRDSRGGLGSCRG